MSTSLVRVLVVLVALLAPAPAFAQGPVPVAPPGDAEPAPDSVSGAAEPSPARAGGRVRALQRAPVVGDVMLLGEGAGRTVVAPLRWGREELGRLGMAVGGLAVLSLLDGAGREVMTSNQNETNDRLEGWVEPFGAVRSLEVLGGFYAVGLALNDPKLRGVAAEGLASSLVASVLITPPLTELIGRPRPRAGRPPHTFVPLSNNHSFPSGHTTQAFAVASVIATEFGHPAVQVASYGLAGAVGVSRMYRGAHFLSDVVGAALIGTTVGRSIARYGQRRRDRLFFTPTMRDGQTLLVLTHTF